MICPSCGYEHVEWDKDKQGSEGDFYELEKEFKMERNSFRREKDTRGVKGCPKCFIIFMSPGW